MGERLATKKSASVMVYGFTDDQSFLYKTKLDLVELNDVFFKSGYDIVDFYFQEEYADNFQVASRGYAIPISKIAENVDTLLSDNFKNRLKRYYLVFKDIDDSEEVYIFLYLLDMKSSSFNLAPLVFVETLGVHNSVFSCVATTKDEDKEVFDVIDHKGIIKNELIFSSFRKFRMKSLLLNEKDSERHVFYKRLLRLFAFVLCDRSPMLLYLTTLGKPESQFLDFYNLSSVYGDDFVEMFTEYVIEEKESARRIPEFESFLHRFVKEGKAYFKEFMLLSKMGGAR